jgi:hypothetical protein
MRLKNSEYYFIGKILLTFGIFSLDYFSTCESLQSVAQHCTHTRSKQSGIRAKISLPKEVLNIGIEFQRM